MQGGVRSFKRDCRNRKMGGGKVRVEKPVNATGSERLDVQ